MPTRYTEITAGGKRYRLDRQEKAVFKEKAKLLHVTSQNIQLLELFVSHPKHALVTRDQVFQHLYADRDVSNEAVDLAIKSLRKALGPDFIVTDHRKGYRLAADIRHFEEIVGNGGPPPPLPTPSQLASSAKDVRVVLFQTHCALAQLQFEEVNPGTLNLSKEQIIRLVLEGATSLGFLEEEAHIKARTIPAQDLSDLILHRTEVRYPSFLPIATLAQAATVRLLYRGSAFEDKNVPEVMRLELTAMLAAKKLGISDAAFMSWHRSQFADGADPQTIMHDLEALVLHTGVL